MEKGPDWRGESEKRRAVIAQTLMVESLLTNEAGTPTHR